MKIMAATGVALFSLVTVFTATIAWFALNKDVDSGGLTITAQQDDAAYIGGVSMHRCLTNESNNTKYTFNYAAAFKGTVGGVQINEFILDDYSQLNTTQPVLLLFPLGELTNGVPAGATAANVKITLNSSTRQAYNNIDEWLPENANDPEDPNAGHTVNNFPFSNATCFRTVAYTGNIPTYTPTGESTPTKYYVDLNSSSQISGDTRCHLGPVQSFVEVSNNSLSWKKEGNTPVSSLTLFDGATDIANPTTTTLKYVGVIVDYYQAALSLIFAVGNNASHVNFDIDFSMLIS